MSEEKPHKCGWHFSTAVRGISQRNPIFEDMITTILYCPRCLSTKELVSYVTRERTNVEATDKEIIRTYVSNMDNLLRTEDLISLKRRVSHNLDVLGYDSAQISNFINNLLSEKIYNQDVLQKYLKEEDRDRIDVIIKGKL